MERRRPMRLGIAGLIVWLAFAPAAAQAGDILQYASDLWDHWKWPSDPPTLTDVARMMDHIQNQILDQGTVVVKQPDVWSQARMTMFRKEFEDTMQARLTQFAPTLAARIARSDSASFSSQTALAASLSPLASGTSLQFNSPGQVQTELATAVNTLNNAPADTPNPTADLPTPPTPPAVTQGFGLLQQMTPATTAKDQTVNPVDMRLGLEPNVFNDQMADYITHLHRLRRVNLGDDTAASAGYGLYLMRVPVSIQPGDDTKKGFGAIVNITASHDFSPRFLQSTYRNLVINDLVDLLTPVVYELIRSGKAWEYQQALKAYWDIRRAQLRQERTRRHSALLPSEPETAQESDYLNNRPEVQAADQNLEAASRNLKIAANIPPTSRAGQRTYAIAPSDVKRVFVAQNLLNLSFAAQQALDLGNSGKPDTWRVRATDVRTYLLHELQSAYDLMEGRCREVPPLLQDVEYIEHLTEDVYCRKFEGPKGIRVDTSLEFNAFYNLYESFTHRLPGNLRFRPVGVLCWGIALQAGLLNRQLREDMKETKGADGFICPLEIDSLFFYPPEPGAEPIDVFQAYIKARWPIITFALEPVTDQQNIDDAFTRRRDLQLAVSFALASGRISFRQAINFTRQLQYEAQTIALNQTVSAFAHGNDTFGWQFTPRYQTPPEESNFQTVTNLLLRGGPGANYQIDHSKIEPGMRELTAVVVMPSFVRSARLDVAGDWFRLHDPDERTIHTARTIELGRRINDTREALEIACKFGNYRREDVERLRARLHQLEVMLPLQTQFVKVPYENTLGGFALFTQGETALVPELTGFEGVQYIDPTRPTDIVVYGKHFSIYETAVVVGGVSVPREGTAIIVTNSPPGTTPPVTGASTLNPSVRDTNGNLVLVTADGKQTYTVADTGNFAVLSREVMRVRIPANVRTAKREDGQPVVELSVSTPNGISNRLQIPATITSSGSIPSASAAAPAALPAGGAQAAVALSLPTRSVVPTGADRPRTIALAGRTEDPAARRTSDDPVRPAELPPLPAEEVLAFRRPFQGQGGAPAQPGAPAGPATPAQGGGTAPGLTHSAQTVVVVPQRAPTVNVAVPVTNMPMPKHHGLFRRRQATTAAPASPAASARGPLRERLLGRP